MYELFQFARLLTLKSHKPHQNLGKVDIKQFAWKEEGEVSFLALLCSNDYILLRYDVTGRPPIIKQLPWLPEKTIASMCFDPTLTWLLIVTQSSQEIYVIPALSVVDSDALVNQIFKTDDVTLKKFKLSSGNVTCALWWQTLDGRQIAVIGTSIGEVVLVDLLGNESFKKVTIDATISDLSLSQDDLQMNTMLMITTVTGNQWRLLLESRTTIFSPDAEVNDLGFDNIDGRSIPPCTILDTAEENRFMFAPTQFSNFQATTLLRPQYARGRHFITAHCAMTSTLQVLDSDAEHSPLFVYKLPVGADNAILTDKLIITVITHSRDRKLMVLSNQKSENSLDDHQDFNLEAVVQEFNLPEGESLIGVEKKRYPFYYHERQEHELSKRLRAGSVITPVKGHDAYWDSSILSIPVTTHTVLDGCIVVTDCSVYEIRPCISPERLFLHLALTMPETTPAENLAISIGLDLTTLSELAAECMLKQSNFTQALKLYTLSKCPATKRTGGLARHGCISETMIHLRQVLSSSSFELNTSERKYLSNMLLHCFVYQLHNPGQATANIHAGLSDFLFGSFSFDEQTALTLLSDFGDVELLLAFAKTRGLVVDALASLVKSHAFSSIPFSALSDLVQRGFSAHLIQSGHGSLLPCLPPEDLTKLLITRPQLTIQNISVLRPLLHVLKHDQLLELAKIFDPSKSVMRGTLIRLQTSRRRTNSLTSLCSFGSETGSEGGHFVNSAKGFGQDTAKQTAWLLTSITLHLLQFSQLLYQCRRQLLGLRMNKEEQRDMQMESLVEFFLLVVLYLNHLRQKTGTSLKPTLDFLSLVCNPVHNMEDLARDRIGSEAHRKLAVQSQPIACGPKHSVVVRNGDLYTWGRSLQGRLGQGDTPQAVCLPTRVETLHMLKLKVDAVACGNEHTLALTQQGVYGWGNSKYGQVGVGTVHVYKRPMLLETLQSETTVAVECGHYHSLTLTADQQVYSWGWNVHGQLGHGHPEDCLIPTLVRSLLNSGVVKIAGGYAHTLVLTETGDVWSFGCGYFGQLGLGTNSKSSLPQKVNIPSTVPIIAIATKYFHCVAVSATDKVYTWGIHPHNLRHVASSVRMAKHVGVHIPEQTSFLTPCIVDTTYVHGKITKVCCGSLHSVLVSEDGGLYVWGRNLEGQLGTGTRQDEKMPKMLTAINDQQIVTVASGGEFTLAFDVEGGLWMWGKNDSGQLGYLKNRRDQSQSSKLPAPTNLRRPNPHSQNIDANIPKAMKGLPASDITNPHWMAMLACLTHNNLWSDSSDVGSECPFDSLPDLDDLGVELYDSCVVPVTLKAFENICDTSFCLQKSVNLEDWPTAGYISCMENNIVQALYYRMRAVIEQIGKADQVDIIKVCAQLTEHHIKLVLESNVSGSDCSKELQFLCSHALYIWQKYSLPISDLESIFSQHLAHLAPWLVDVVLRQQVGNDANVPSSSSSSFSICFSLRVLQAVMDPSVATSNRSGFDFQKLIAGVNVDESLLQQKVNLQNRGKLTPQDKLWTDILKNLKKETGMITLTNSQLDHLDELQTRTSTATSSKSIVFTCGHLYSESTFKSETSALTTQLTSGGNKLPNSADLLKHILSQPGLKVSACPKCILHEIQTS